MSTTYYVAWWNVENLFDEENAPPERRPEKVARAIGDDIAGWTPALRDRKIDAAGVGDRADERRAGARTCSACARSRTGSSWTCSRGRCHDACCPAAPYEIVHADTDDARGIDVAFLYDTDAAASRRRRDVLPRGDAPQRHPRDRPGQLPDARRAHAGSVFGNHWPSRCGGQYESAGLPRHRRGNPGLLPPAGPGGPRPGHPGAGDGRLQRRAVRHLAGDPRVEHPAAAQGRPARRRCRGSGTSCGTPLGDPEGSFYFDNEPNVLDQFLVNKNMAGTTVAQSAAQADSARDPALRRHRHRALPRPPAVRRDGQTVDEDGFSDHFPITVQVVEKE